MESDLSFSESIELANSIIERFKKIEGKPWGAEGAVIELQKQVGELSKLIMVQEEYYFSGRDKLDSQYESSKENIGDELADIFYAIIRISNHYGIDLHKAHVKARAEEDEFLKSKGV